MNTQPMPACEALAADPARYIFKGYLAELTEAANYEERYRACCRLGGYLGALLECDVITREEYRAMCAETQNFVWGPRP